MPGFAAVFIDGGYLDYVLRLQFGQARIDYGALAKAMVGDSELLRAYYYHCLPYQGSPPTDVEKTRFAGMQSFTNRLRRLARFEVRLGKLAYRGLDASNSPIFEQNRSTRTGTRRAGRPTGEEGSEHRRASSVMLL